MTRKRDRVPGSSGDPGDPGPSGDLGDPGDPGAPPFDPKDPEKLRRILLDLRVACDDIDSVVEDMLAPVRERELGHAKHRELYDEARRTVVELLEHMLARDTGGSRIH